MNKGACGDCINYNEQTWMCEIKRRKGRIDPQTEGCNKWEFDETHG